MRFPAPGPTAAAPRKAVSCRAWAGAAAGLLGPTSWAHAALAADGAAAVSTSSPWLLALAVVAAGGWAWQARQNQSQRAALQQLRMERLALADTLDVWQWRSDAQHRITHWRPPSQAGDDAWQPPAALGQLLWTLFEAEDAAGLQTRLTQHASLPGLTVRVACNAAQHGTGHGPAAPPSPPPAPSLAQKQTQILHAQVPMRVQMQLRAAPLTDAQGQFAGHMGTLRRLDEPAAQGHDADPGADPAPAPGLNGATAPAATLDGPPDKDHESFIYTVSHDLRAPIRVVEGFTRILKEDYGRLLDRVGNDHLDRVLGAAARMNSMIDALLALSQLSTQPLARQPVNLSQLAGFILDDLKRQSPERAVTVHVADGLHTQGDPTLLRLVLENLLGNAWKYTGKCAGAEVWFGTDPDDPTVYMVRDNGAGFDMRFADRLFGVFQRLHSASDFQGTGVGLASVRRIVRRHGGEVWAESEVGRGAVFRFTLAPSAAHKLAERQWRQPAKRA